MNAKNTAAQKTADIFKGLGGFYEITQIADEELDKVEKEPNDCFNFLSPIPVLETKSPALFRAHCKELLERYQVGEDTTEPTKAEVLAWLAETALGIGVPLGHDAVAYYYKLYKEVFGEIEIPGMSEHDMKHQEHVENPAVLEKVHDRAEKEVREMLQDHPRRKYE